MKSINQLKIANILRKVARYGLLTIVAFVIGFALLSGAEKYGGGLYGVVQNSPNALPWLVLLGLVYVAWRWEKIGGTLITTAGIVAVYFFNFEGTHFYWQVFVLTLLIVILGMCFLISAYLRKHTVS